MLINGKYRCAACAGIIESDSAICNCGFNNATSTNPGHCLQIGTLLSNQYVIGRVIGEGGFGITYVGWDINLDMKVAIKEFFLNGFSTRDTTISSEISSSYGENAEMFDKFREKFLNEAKILASFMEEPGIVSVYRFLRENNTAYIVMEFVEGMTLKDYLKQKQRLAVDETIAIMVPIVNSLAKIHGKGLIHRDISPDNIIISVDGRGKLIDFGAARESSYGNKSLSIVLKHGYAPIEQYNTRGNQGPWTDVYALSATMYKCITGQVPVEAIDRISGYPIAQINEIVPECSKAVNDAIMKGLNVRAEDRYRSAHEMMQAIIAAMNYRQPEIVRNTEPEATVQFAGGVNRQTPPPVVNLVETAPKTPKKKTGFLSGIIIAEIAIVAMLIIAIVINVIRIVI